MWETLRKLPRYWKGYANTRKYQRGGGIPPFSRLTPLSGFQGPSELEEVTDLENGSTVASTANRTTE